MIPEDTGATRAANKPEGRQAVPANLNVALSLAQIAASVALLVGASTFGFSVLGAACVITFTFVMQTGFSLIHEAEHDKLHPTRWVNDALGILTAAIFPGSFQFMKVAHLSHHRKNRSDAELVDYVRNGESFALKTIQYYALITGVIWLGVPLLSALIALTPSFGSEPTDETPKSGAALYLQFVREARPYRVRLELIFVVTLWTLILKVLPISFEALAVSYGAFAFSWASQQYVYHIRTPRHLVEGAFNLRLPRALELLYLNFNHHLTHHRNVMVPWIHLPELSERPERAYLATYLDLWRPPEPVERAFPVQFQAKGPLEARPTLPEAANASYVRRD
ncbi:MAG: fatty acid desaturase [Deltaproteobacteria bacterium]|nr:fatty acid desaturase [Deltaproteobacteria bacterium]